MALWSAAVRFYCKDANRTHYIILYYQDIYATLEEESLTRGPVRPRSLWQNSHFGVSHRWWEHHFRNPAWGSALRHWMRLHGYSGKEKKTKVSAVLDPTVEMEMAVLFQETSFSIRRDAKTCLGLNISLSWSICYFCLISNFANAKSFLQSLSSSTCCGRTSIF